MTRSPVQEAQPAHRGEVLLCLQWLTIKHTLQHIGKTGASQRPQSLLPVTSAQTHTGNMGKGPTGDADLRADSVTGHCLQLPSGRCDWSSFHSPLRKTHCVLLLPVLRLVPWLSLATWKMQLTGTSWRYRGQDRCRSGGLKNSLYIWKSPSSLSKTVFPTNLLFSRWLFFNLGNSLTLPWID